MRERWQFFLISIFTILIAFGGYFLLNYIKYDGDLVINKYEVYFNPDGDLEEKYEYEVNGHFIMLCRIWNAPLLYNQSFEEPFVRVDKINCSYIGYVKDYYGNVYSTDNLYKYEIWEKAYINEVGCFNPDGYEKGIYKIEYFYTIYPPVQYDGEVYHINIKLANEHIPYKNFEIYINNSAKNIIKIFTHPPFKISKENDFYIIRGKSQRNGLIEFEILLNSTNQKFLFHDKNLMEKTINENERYHLYYGIASIFSYVLKIIVFAFPLLIAVIYYLHGRERKFFVPKYLSFIPKKRKPWMVNLLFKKDATDFDNDGLYATLLDLHERGNIRIENGKEIKIKLISEEGTDRYENKVYSFLKKHSENGIFSTNLLKEEIKSLKGDETALSKLKKEMDSLYKVRDARDFIINGRYLMLKYFSLSLLIFLISISLYLKYFYAYPVLFDVFFYSLIFSIQFLSTVLAPSTLFGKWKKEYYKEKLQWDAFKRFLLDMAHLQKYSREDILIWKDWLIYATALGIGKKVTESFKKLDIRIDEIDLVPAIYISFASVNRTMIATYSSSGHGSGGFSAGGGFGGGGAGGR